MPKAITKDFRVSLTPEQWEEIRNLKHDGVPKNLIAYAGIEWVLKNKELKESMRKDAAKRKAEAAEENKIYQAKYAAKRRAKARAAAGVAIITTNIGRDTGGKGEK